MAARKYHADIAHEIIRRLTDGETLTAIAKTEGYPPLGTIAGWGSGDYPPYTGFTDDYARARNRGWERMAEELLDIADDSTRDVRVVDGEEVVDHDHIARARLRVDSRKWLLSKRLPKTFGDKIHNTNQQLDKDGQPMDPVVPVVRVTFSDG